MFKLLFGINNKSGLFYKICKSIKLTNLLYIQALKNYLKLKQVKIKQFCIKETNKSR